MIRVLAVDDHALLRDGIAALIGNQSDMELVGEASNGREAIELFRQHQPDVTLMDLQMPEMGGIDALSAIRGEFPEARIIVLTTYAGDVQVFRALKAGARGFLLKGLLRKELLETIRAVHAGQKRLPPEIAAEIAEHATDDSLDSAGNRRASIDRRRECEQGDRRAVVAHRRNREGPRQEHPRQTGRQRPHPRRHHRAEARNHRNIGVPRPLERGVAKQGFLGCRARLQFSYHYGGYATFIFDLS